MGKRNVRRERRAKRRGFLKRKEYIIQEWMRHQISNTLSRYPTCQPSSNCGLWFGGAGKFVS